MNNELTVTNQEVVTKEKIQEYLTAFNMTSLSKEEQMQFIEIASAYQLNPFKREIYCVPYMKNVKNEQTDKWEKQRALSIITGYEVYLKRAERTGKLDGWKCETKGSGNDMIAIATIHRKDWKNPFQHEVYFIEAGQFDDKGQPRSMWKKMPKFMLKKVCMAQAFRLCFPDEFGGMPYIADELPENMTIDIKPNQNNETDDLDAEKKAKEEADRKAQEALDKLHSFVDSNEYVKKAFQILEYTERAQWAFCEGNKWNQETIKNHLNLLVEKKA